MLFVDQMWVTGLLSAMVQWGTVMMFLIGIPWPRTVQDSINKAVSSTEHIATMGELETSSSPWAVILGWSVLVLVTRLFWL